MGNHGCALFQLAPIHGVFRGTVGKPGWSVLDDKLIVFGEVGAGVCMTVAVGRGLGRITVRQVIGNGEDEDQDETRGWDRESGWFDEAKAQQEREKEGWAFEADVKRGNWIAEFEIQLIEVWAARE